MPLGSLSFHEHVPSALGTRNKRFQARRHTGTKYNMQRICTLGDFPRRNYDNTNESTRLHESDGLSTSAVEKWRSESILVFNGRLVWIIPDVSLNIAPSSMDFSFESRLLPWIMRVAGLG